MIVVSRSLGELNLLSLDVVVILWRDTDILEFLNVHLCFEMAAIFHTLLIFSMQ